MGDSSKAGKSGRSRASSSKAAKQAEEVSKPMSGEIKLKSSDGETVTVDVSLICGVSTKIKKIVEEKGYQQGGPDEIPIPDVNAKTLAKVILWATRYRELDNTDGRPDEMTDWETDFVRVDQTTLFECILAAHNWEIQGLLNLTCKAVAHQIKGMTTEEIRKTFNIKNDFTRLEEKKVRWQNEKWRRRHGGGSK